MRYVGARYIPIYSTWNNGVWDSAHQYEQLEIVSYNGDYYISGTIVPPGIDINNTQYWHYNGSFNPDLAEINKKYDSILNRVIDVKQFGAKGDGISDDSDAIQAAIDYCIAQKQGYTIMLNGGIFAISKTINLWYDYNNSLLINGAVLKAIASMDFMISIGYRKTDHFPGFYPYGVYGNGTIDCANIAGGIVTNPQRPYITIKDIQIRNCEKIGISIGLESDTTYYSSQYKINNVGIYGNENTNNGIGISDNHGDGYVNNSFIYYMRTGIYTRAASFLDNIHIWGGQNIAGKEYEQEITGIKAGSSLYLSNIYMDTIPVGIYLNDNSECQGSNLMFMNGEDFTTTCFNANYNCAINIDSLNIVDFNNRVFNPLYLRDRQASNYFSGLKRFTANFTEKLTINYQAIVWNEFNNLINNKYTRTLARNYSTLNANYTLIGYFNQMRSRIFMKLELATLAFFDFVLDIETNGNVTIKENNSSKISSDTVNLVIGQSIENEYGTYLPLYAYTETQPSSTTVVASVNVDGTQNAGFYPIVSGSISGNPTETNVTAKATITAQ